MERFSCALLLIALRDLDLPCRTRQPPPRLLHLHPHSGGEVVTQQAAARRLCRRFARLARGRESVEHVPLRADEHRVAVRRPD